MYIDLRLQVEMIFVGFVFFFFGRIESSKTFDMISQDNTRTHAFNQADIYL